MRITRAQVLEMAARTRGFTDDAEFALTQFGGALHMKVYNTGLIIQSDGVTEARSQVTGKALGPDYRQSDEAVASA